MTALVDKTEENIAIRLRYATCSDVGMRREENQDSFGVFDHGADSLFVVADGMGGVRGGAIASQLAIKIFTEMTAGKDSFSVDDLVAMTKKANNEIYEHGIKNPDYAGMGTTAVGLCFHEGQLIVLNVGDSRAYRVRGEDLEQLTEDHTLVSELIKAGTLSEDQRENHPVSHMLTRSLGPTPSVDVDCWLTDSAPQIGDKYFLCSDGLYNMVKPPQLKYIVSNYDAHEAARLLVAAANQNGGADNITCIVIEVLSAIEVPEEECDNDSGLNSFSTIGTLELSESLAFGDDDEDEDTQDSEEDSETLNNGNSDFVIIENIEPEQPTFENKIDISEVASSAHEAKKEVLHEAKPSRGRFGYLILPVLCLVIGLLYGKSISSSGNSEDIAIPSNYQVALAPKDIPSTPIPEEPTEQVVKVVAEDIVDQGERVEEASDRYVETPDYAKIAEDKVLIREKIFKLKKMLSSLEKPITGAAIAILNKDRRRTNDIDNLLKSIKQQKDELEEKKEEWLSRGSRMKRETVQRMATEISRYSGEVDEVWLDYQGYVHRYIKAREDAKFSDNEKNKEEVKIVEQQMHNKLEDVRKVINKVIKREIKKADEGIQALISRKIELEDEKQTKNLSIDHAKAILSGDPEERNAIKRRLEQDLFDLESELDGYLQLLPDADTSDVFSEEVGNEITEEVYTDNSSEGLNVPTGEVVPNT